MVGLCAALVTLFAQLSYATEWHVLDNTADGIQIFKRELDDSGLVSFRGIGVVDAPLSLVATVIFDTDRRREWIEGLAASWIIRWRDKNDFVEYDHISMPIFFRDRDFVSNVNMGFDLTTKEIVFRYKPSGDPAAPRTSYIRGELISTTFILSPIDNDKKTRVDAEFLCDPKGWIPKWLVNFFLKDWPKTTFRNLRTEVLKADIAVDPRFSILLQRESISR